MAGRKNRLTLSLPAATLVAMTTLIEAKGQLAPEGESQLRGPLEPLRPGLDEDQVFAELETITSFALGVARLHGSQNLLGDLKGKVHAEEIGQKEFRAPDKQRFVVTSKSGS